MPSLQVFQPVTPPNALDCHMPGFSQIKQGIAPQKETEGIAVIPAAPFASHSPREIYRCAALRGRITRISEIRLALIGA